MIGFPLQDIQPQFENKVTKNIGSSFRPSYPFGLFLGLESSVANRAESDLIYSAGGSSLARRNACPISSGPPELCQCSSNAGNERKYRAQRFAESVAMAILLCQGSYESPMF